MSGEHSNTADMRRREQPARQLKARDDGSFFSLSLDTLYAARDQRKRHSEAAEVDAVRQERDLRAGEQARFNTHGLTDADRQAILSKVEAAFESGQREVMLVSFPSDYCTDGGRRINNRLPDWQDTLPPGAQSFVAFWQDALQSGGFGIGARILSFPGGVLGDAGLFITWPQSGT